MKPNKRLIFRLLVLALGNLPFPERFNKALSAVETAVALKLSGIVFAENAELKHRALARAQRARRWRSIQVLGGSKL
jgi:hypothetical protein